jgi:hypothetical protein
MSIQISGECHCFKFRRNVTLIVKSSVQRDQLVAQCFARHDPFGVSGMFSLPLRLTSTWLMSEMFRPLYPCGVSPTTYLVTKSIPCLGYRPALPHPRSSRSNLRRWLGRRIAPAIAYLRHLRLARESLSSSICRSSFPVVSCHWCAGSMGAERRCCFWVSPAFIHFCVHYCVLCPDFL